MYISQYQNLYLLIKPCLNQSCTRNYHPICFNEILIHQDNIDAKSIFVMLILKILQKNYSIKFYSFLRCI